jgi:hypothetical protein
MPEHVRMDGEGESGAFASPLNHSTNAHTAERLTSFIDKYICELRLLLALQSLKSGYLIAFKIVGAVIASRRT